MSLLQPRLAGDIALYSFSRARQNLQFWRKQCRLLCAYDVRTSESTRCDRLQDGIELDRQTSVMSRRGCGSEAGVGRAYQSGGG